MRAPRGKRHGRLPEASRPPFAGRTGRGPTRGSASTRKGMTCGGDQPARIDWAHDRDRENLRGLPEEAGSIFGSDVWNRMPRQERATTRRHQQAWQLSQFLHGEQGALVCTAKIVQQVPSVDAKFYAATQVMDEARHVEAYKRLLHDKFELAYPITPTL